jgi:hypothetical protein
MAETEGAPMIELILTVLFFALLPWMMFDLLWWIWQGLLADPS